jgi:hypothetical protein
MADPGVVRAASVTLLRAGAITLVLALAPIIARASASPWFGFTDYAASGGQTTATEAASLASQEGSGSVRVTLHWYWVQPTDTTPNFGTYDAIYDADLARGIHPMFVLVGSPSWARPATEPCGNGGYCPPDPSHDAEWASFAGQVAARYPQLAGIEIWNEPNMNWAWGTTPDPARYTQLVREAYTAIKAANPNLPVLAGALAPFLNTTITSYSYPATLFLQNMFAAGAHGYMDGLSMHPYPGSMDPWFTYKAISTLTEIRNSAGDSSPVWITETGLSTTGGFTTTQQALVDPNLAQALLAQPDIAGVYINGLVEQTTMSTSDPNRGYGVMYANLSPKPAYCTIARAFHTGYKCPLLVAQPWPSATQSARWAAENALQWAASAALRYHAANGSYSGLTPAVLHTLDPRLSASGPVVVAPGAAANPAAVGVWQWGSTGVLLCNASNADRSYCIFTPSPGNWTYGDATGTIYAAAHAVLYGQSNTW